MEQIKTADLIRERPFHFKTASAQNHHVSRITLYASRFTPYFSRSVKKAIGIEESKISISAGAAA
jgi:hypothetical protein